jgi:hypothetical protein
MLSMDVEAECTDRIQYSGPSGTFNRWFLPKDPHWVTISPPLFFRKITPLLCHLELVSYVAKLVRLQVCSINIVIISAEQDKLQVNLIRTPLSIMYCYCPLGPFSLANQK